MLRDLVEKNRSCRGFDESRRITREELVELVDLTRYVASGCNFQPLKFFLACDRETVEAILPLTTWAKALTGITLPRSGKHPAAFIVICHDTAIVPNPNAALPELGAMAQTILLGATERGLGGCMIANFRAAALKETLHLREGLEPKLVLAMGKPAEERRIVPIGADGSIDYYRDENDVHCVPKRDLKDILI